MQRTRGHAQIIEAGDSPICRHNGPEEDGLIPHNRASPVPQSSISPIYLCTWAYAGGAALVVSVGSTICVPSATTICMAGGAGAAEGPRRGVRPPRAAREVPLRLRVHQDALGSERRHGRSRRPAPDEDARADARRRPAASCRVLSQTCTLRCCFNRRYKTLPAAPRSLVPHAPGARIK